MIFGCFFDAFLEFEWKNGDNSEKHDKIYELW